MINFWNGSEGRIWWRAIISFIVVTIMVTWIICCLLSKTFLPLEWGHITLVLGGLGINLGQQLVTKQNEKASIGI